MPSLQQISRKISSVKGTRRIMSAMKLIAAVKLQKAQLQLNSYRPYSDAYKEITFGIAQRSDPEHHPLLRRPGQSKKLHLVFLTSDRGLCGSFNNGLIRTLENYLSQDATGFDEIFLSFIGRRGKDHFGERELKVVKYYVGITENNYSDAAQDLSKVLTDEFVNSETDQVILVYNYFKSVLSQEITFERLLPLNYEEGKTDSTEYIYEPTRKKILADVIPKYVQVRIERAIQESLTSEHASRMTAMENATSNADDVIKKLTLLFNKTRQAIITTELMDIVNGTEAQKQGGND